MIQAQRLRLDKPAPVGLPWRVGKKLFLWSGLFLAGLVVGLEIAWLVGFFRPHQESPVRPGVQSVHGTVAITVSATVDGSERFMFTAQGVQHEHGQWQPPKNVLFNDQPWEDLTQPPPGWAELAVGLDLKRAVITERSGRDVISLEATHEGFDLFLADSQMGAGKYAVTISIPRK